MKKLLLTLTVFLFLFTVEMVNACSNYISYEEGNVPILLTSPHGAGQTMLLPGVPSREGGGFKHFVNRADQYTDQVTWSIAEALKQKGLSPFVVVAGIHRSQIDFNRPPEQAYEVPDAEACYRHYHQKIKKAITKIKQNWIYGFMLDVHGQSKYDYDILRGTRNQQTIAQLITRFGKDVTEEEEGFFTVLRELGYSLHPMRAEREQYYYGGFTLKQYGSHLPTGIDAIQVEIGRDIRVDHDRRHKMANDLAGAIQHFYQRYYINDLLKK